MASDKMTKEATSDRRSRRNLYLDVELIRQRAPLASLGATRVQFGLGAVLQDSITPRGRIRRQPARRSLPDFQTTGRSREDENEAPCEAGVVDIGRARFIR